MENGVHLARLARRVVFAGVRVLAVKLPFSGRYQEGRHKKIQSNTSPFSTWLHHSSAKTLLVLLMILLAVQVNVYQEY